MAHHRRHHDDEEEEAAALLGVGRPSVGFRNWEGYAAAREGPETRFRDRRGMCAKAQAELLQRRRPELMLDRGSLEEVLREDRAARRARRLEGMWLQGNSLWAPRMAPIYASEPHAADDDDGLQQHRQPRQRRRRSRLLVHLGGPALDRLHLSLVHEEMQEEADAGKGAAAPRCWMSGGRWASAGVRSIRQLAPLNQYEGEEGGVGMEGGAFPFLSDPPTCFARGTAEAALFQLRRFEDERAELEMVEMGAASVPYYVSPVQHLQFPHRLLDVATQLASVHRAAFLTENLRVYEWSSARGAAPVKLALPAAVTKGADAAAAVSAWPAGHQARLAWGAHPRCLWLSGGGALCQLDLRQRTAIAFPIDPPRWPVDLLPPTMTAAAGPDAGPAAASRGGAAVLRATAAVTAVGPIERHPLDENLLFVAADHCLLALDLRQPRRPLSILPQADPTHLLALGVFSSSPSPSSSQAPRTWIAAGCRTLPRLHLHVETADRGPQGLGIVEEWLARGVGGGDGRHQQQQQRRALWYETATFVNWDSTPARESPVWLAGLGVLPPLPWAGEAGGGSNNSSLILPYVTSLGDVYLQRALCHAPVDAVAGLRRFPPDLLPCGVSAHVKASGDDDDNEGPLPSSALLQAWDADSLREHAAVPVDPPARAFGGLVAAGLDAAAAAASGRAGLKQEGREPEPEPEPEPDGAATTAVAAAVARVRGGLGDFMAQHPRTLLEVAAELERLAPGALGAVGGAEEGRLRVLHGVLSREKRAGLVRAHAGDARAGGAAARPEEPRRATAPTVPAAVPGGDDDDDGSAQWPRGGCSCADGSGSPCGASSCLQPARALYWVKNSDALVPSTTAGLGNGGFGVAGGRVGGEGLDEDMLQSLRGEW